MQYSELFAKRISDLCMQQGLSINRLAIKAGLNQSTVDNIMHSNSQNPNMKTLNKIANAFGMTLSQFTNFDELNALKADITNR